VQIPTNRPIARLDLNDAVFKTRKEKLNAIVDAIEEAHAMGQPVLVGTVTIEASEELSDKLRRRGIPHKVLNAKFHELEAEIIKDAGQKDAVTIATNMAGRGTDIKLGEGVRELGGLKIIGTERHESRRIDNQLRGRAGRQGDPGESRFYISLEDDLMRLFGAERLINMFSSIGLAEGEQIEHNMLSSAVEKAQKKIEDNNFGIRKNLLEYDRVNNEQREIIYAERRKVLEGCDMRQTILNMAEQVVEGCIDTCINEDTNAEHWDIQELNHLLLPIVPIAPVKLTEEQYKHMRKKELVQQLKAEAIRHYEEKEALFPDKEQLREIERVILLRVIDKKWMDHIDDMDQLRQGIGVQAYGQRDPLTEYKFQGCDMFNAMTAAIAEDTVKSLMNVQVEAKVERQEVAKVTGTNRDDSVKGPIRRVEKKPQRNDLCPCGSGKKYKFCCGKNE